MSHVEPELDDNELIPRSLRKPLYRVYGLLGVVILGLVVGYSTANGVDNLPVWVTVTSAVYAAVGGPLGFVAQRNVPQA